MRDHRRLRLAYLEYCFFAMCNLHRHLFNILEITVQLLLPPDAFRAFTCPSKISSHFYNFLLMCRSTHGFDGIYYLNISSSTPNVKNPIDVQYYSFGQYQTIFDWLFGCCPLF